jgi:uncharacterized membrane protein YkvA (DUF1232 family)
VEIQVVRLGPTSIFQRLGFAGVLQLLRHLPIFIKLFARLVKDPRVALAPKLILAAAFLYLIVPFDLLPDFIPGIGQIDDLLVIVLAARLFLQLCPRDVVRAHIQSLQ